MGTGKSFWIIIIFITRYPDYTYFDNLTQSVPFGHRSVDVIHSLHGADKILVN